VAPRARLRPFLVEIIDAAHTATIVHGVADKDAIFKKLYGFEVGVSQRTVRGTGFAR